MDQRPSVGRIVLFHESDGDIGQFASGTNGTRIHPAVITRVWSDEMVNLHVMFDASPSEPRNSVHRIPEDQFTEGEDYIDGGWRWPPRVA